MVEKIDKNYSPLSAYTKGDIVFLKRTMLLSMLTGYVFYGSWQ